MGFAGLVWNELAAAQEQPAAAVKSSPEATRLYQDAANAQNGMAFDIAVEEWQKFLKDHPKDPLAAKAQHYLGVCQLQLKKPDQAAEAFQAVIKNHPKFELLEETLLNLASCQYSQASGGKPEHLCRRGRHVCDPDQAIPQGQVRRGGTLFSGRVALCAGEEG